MFGVTCWNTSTNDNQCHVNIEIKNPPGATHINGTSKSPLLDVAVQVARKATLIVLCVGIDWSIEREGRDRVHIGLPVEQMRLANAILSDAELRKRTVVVLTNGGQLSVDIVKQWAPAVIEAFYPGQTGGQAVAEAIFGDINAFGKLCYTVYKSDYVSHIPKDDMGKFSTSTLGPSPRCQNGPMNKHSKRLSTSPRTRSGAVVYSCAV